MKIIPAIDLMQGKVVRLIKGNPKNMIVYSNNPLEVAKRFELYADALHIIDLDATLSLGNNKNIIKTIADNVNIEIEVGGGIRSIEYALEILNYADSIIIGTLAYRDRSTLIELMRYAKDRIIIALDHRNGKVMTDGWVKDTNEDLITSINYFKNIGIEKFLVTNIERDGTLEGVDLTTYERISKIGKIIASGGISSINDIINLKRIGIYGAILGKSLYDGRIKIENVKDL